MDFEQVKGEMLGLQRQGAFDVSLPAFESLPGKTCDQIKTNVVETRGAQFVKSLERVGGSMRTAQLRQCRIVKRLRTKARAVHAETSKRTQLIVRHGTGIHLHCYLRTTVDVELTMHLRENPIELVRRQQRRSTATEINRIHTGARILRRSDFLNDGANIRFRKFTLIKPSGEVAIGTTRTTKWGVDIKPCESHFIFNG